MTRRTDTIAALATPAGRGALAVVRIAGPGAFEVLGRLAPGTAATSPRSAALRSLYDPEGGERLDRALVTRFPAPHSYSGEDTVELSCHGGMLTPRLVLDAVLRAGARAAEPGEFTRRAYLNGKLDLLQAEAVADLIDADSPAFRRSAVHRMERGLSARIEALREGVIQTEALLSYSIDFPDEDEPPAPPERIVAEAREVAVRIERLLATAPEGERLRDGALTVLAGRPNSGKSSLFNALVGRERAIVTEVAGTTRDAVEADVTLAGYPFRLVDTAGLRESADRVEGIGIEVARRYIGAADLILFCAEAGRPLEPDEAAFIEERRHRTMLVRTKRDQLKEDPEPGSGELHVSVEGGEGLAELRAVLRDRAFGGIVREADDTPLLTRERHRRALEAARGELREFDTALLDGVPAEFAATHLREAVEALEGIIGVVAPDDVLDRLFADFCVGK